MNQTNNNGQDGPQSLKNSSFEELNDAGSDVTSDISSSVPPLKGRMTASLMELKRVAGKELVRLNKTTRHYYCYTLFSCTPISYNLGLDIC